MTAEELPEFLKSRHISYSNNDLASANLTAKEYLDFYLTSSGIGIKNLKLIPELLFGKFQLSFFKLYAIKQFLFGKHENLNGNTYLVIHNFWSGGYHHWLVEALLKLVVSQLDYKNYVLLLPASYQPFALQSLQKFEFQKIVYLKEKHIYRVDKAMVISNPNSGFFDKIHINNMRDFWSKKPSKPSRKIYISRRNAALRVITNEDEIYPLLYEYGYEVIETQTLSFQEQINLFADTKEVISIHGAALTNMVFMQPGTKVIELYRELKLHDNMNLCYYRLAMAASIIYHCFFLKIAKRNNDVDRSDLIIDKNAFALLLKSLK